jgi:hypothetical protein
MRKAEWPSLKATNYGFIWGPVEVERSASTPNIWVLTLRTDRQMLEVRVTPTGLIRVGAPLTFKRKP